MSRVAIVGAGIIGLAAAYELRRRKHEVTVVDRGLPGDQCSRGNAGWICPSFSGPLPAPGLGLRSLMWMLQRNSPLHIKLSALPRLAPWLWKFWRHCNARDYEHGLHAVAALNDRTMQSFDRWAADGVSFEMHQSGILWAFLDDRHVRAATADFIALDRLGYHVPRPIPGRDMRELEPGLSDHVNGGFMVEHERFVRPESLSRGLAQRIAQLGVEMRTGVDVSGGVSHGEVLETLHTSDGGLSADAFVIAAGAWSGQVAECLGSSVPIQAGKGYSITLPSPAPAFTRSLYFAEAKAAVTPFDGHLRIAGTMELSGVNTRFDPRRLEALKRSTEQYCRVRPAWDEGDNWVGARPITPDGLPLISRLPGFGNVYIASGHGMTGMTLAPATAELIADLIEDRTSPNANRAFDSRRFAMA